MIRRHATDSAAPRDRRVALQRHSVLLFALTLAFTSGVLQLLAQHGHEHLFLNLDSTAAGVLPGVLTAHLVHVSWMHYLFNLVGLALVLSLFREVWTPLRLVAIFLICALAVDAGLWWLSPQVPSYAGLSGVLHGLLAAGAVFAWRGAGGVASLVLLGTVTKLIWEQQVGPSAGMSELIGAPVIVDAHLYGFAAGAVAALFVGRRGGRRQLQAASPGWY